MFRKSLVSVAGAAVFAISASVGTAEANVGSYDPSAAFIEALSTTHSGVPGSAAAASQPAKTVTYDAQKNFFADLTTGSARPVELSGQELAVMPRTRDFSSDFVADLSSTR